MTASVLHPLAAPVAIPSKGVAVAILTAICALVLWLFSDSTATLYAQWQSSYFRYGPLVPVVAMFFLVTESERLVGLRLNISIIGLLSLLGALAVWLLGVASHIQTLEHLGLFLILHGAVLALCGWTFYRQSAFYLWFLLLAVPFGTRIVPWLMEVTADISEILLTVFGVTHYRSGVMLMLPGGSFEVAEVCSGFKFLGTGAFIGIIAARLWFRTGWRQILFLALLPPLLILTNGVRAFIVMVVASAAEMQFFVGQDHVIFGWILFAMVLWGIIVMAQRLSDAPPLERQPSASAS